MPTGYTADVQSGKITEFKDFAMQCAPTEFAPSTYSAERLAEAKAELQRLQALTVDQQGIECERHNTEELDYWQRSVDERAAQSTRYHAMIDKVNAWRPPTPDHVEMKSFMLNQLQESLRFDCGYSLPKPTPKSRGDWYEAALAKAVRVTDYHANEHGKDVERANKRTKWLRDLRASLSE